MSNRRGYSRVGPQTRDYTLMGSKGTSTGMWAYLVVAALAVGLGAVGLGLAIAANNSASSVDTRTRNTECSSIRAFQSDDGNQGFTPEAHQNALNVIKNMVDRGTAVGGYIHGSIGANGERDKVYYGSRDGDFVCIACNGLALGAIPPPAAPYFTCFAFYSAGVPKDCTNGPVNTKPYTGDTIFDIASRGKLFTATAMMKSFDMYNVGMRTPLAEIIPEFASVVVAVPVTPSAIIGPETDPLSTAAASTTVTVTTGAAHGLTTGDTIALEGLRLSETDPLSTAAASTTVTVTTSVAHGLTTGDTIVLGGSPGTIDGIPQSELIATHVVTVTGGTTFTISVTTPATAGVAGVGGSITIQVVLLDGIPETELITTHVVAATPSPTTFEITTTTPATAGVAGVGGSITIKKVVAGTKQTLPHFCDPLYHYYTEQAQETDLTLGTALRYGTGYSLAPFEPVCLGVTFCPVGYEEQCAVQQALYAANGFNGDGYETSGPMVGLNGVDVWKVLAVNVPAICQPDTCFTYDSSAFIMGAMIEALDQSAFLSYSGVALSRDIPTWFQEELFVPLGMVDSGHIILPSDTDKINRFTIKTLAGTGIPTKFIFPGIDTLSSDPDVAFAPRSYYNTGSFMYTTPNDWDKLADMLLRGGRLPDGATFISKDLIAMGSQGQNLHYTNTAPGIPVADASRTTTWGLGSAVSSGGWLTSSTRTNFWIGFYTSLWTIDYTNNVQSHGDLSILPIPSSSRKIWDIYLRNLKCHEVSDTPFHNVEVVDAKNIRTN